MIIKNIPLDTIDCQDNTFCISYPLRDKILESSLRGVGIAQPVMLLERRPYIIIAGFKRIEAASNMGLKKIPALIVEMEPKEALLHAIHQNMGRGLNIVEKSQAVAKMVRSGFSQEEISQVMELLSLSSHEKIIGRCIAVASAAGPVKDFIIARNMSMKNIDYLFNFPPEERAVIVSALSPIRTTEGTLREILQMLNIIRIRRGALSIPLDGETTDINVLRGELKRQVNPLLSSLHNSYMEIRGKMGLPPDMDIKIDPFFEKEYIDVLIRVKNPHDLIEALKKLKGIIDDGHIRSIFELTQG